MKISVIILTILTAVPTWAEERYEFYNGVRGLGMGGAAIAVVNDETALLVNPAGLGKLRDYFFTIFDPEIGVSENTERIAGLKVLDTIKPQEALDMANKNPDLHLHSRAQVFPSLVVPNFGMGVFGRYEVNAEVNSTDDTFKYDYTNDYALVFGFNFRIWDGIIKLGANSRIINRVEIRRDDLATNSTGLTVNGLASEGIGIASDVALVLAAPIAWLPTIAAVYRDVGRTSYNLRDGLFVGGEERPDSTPESLDVAVALFPIMGKTSRASWTAEYRDILTMSDEEDKMKRFHAGVEFNFSDAFFIRGGMNQRYWTAGLELAISKYQFQMATYGEEIGTAEENRVDRRYVAKFAFRF